MCDIASIELKHINEKLDQLVEGQKVNVTEHTEIKEILAGSKERWKSQFKTNDRHESDIGKLKSANKGWAAVTGLLATIGVILGIK